MALNARDAADRGATVLTRTKAVAAARGAEGWTLTLQERERGATRSVAGRPWSTPPAPGSGRCSTARCGRTPPPRSGWCRARTSWCRGSTTHDRCYIFQNPDSRIFFAIPYETRLHADRHHRPRLRGRPGRRARLARGGRLHLRSASEYFARRSTRRRRLELFGRAPALRQGRRRRPGGDARLRARPRAPGAGRRCSASSAASSPPTAARRARAGDAGAAPAGRRRARRAGPGASRCPAATSRSTASTRSWPSCARDWPFLAAAHARRLARHYGTEARDHPGRRPQLRRPRPRLRRHPHRGRGRPPRAREWARTAADIAWRRTKLGLRLTAAEMEALEDAMAERCAAIGVEGSAAVR